jgi:hypothetical protein
MAYAELELRVQYLYVAAGDSVERVEAVSGQVGTGASGDARHTSRPPRPGHYRIEVRFNHSKSDVDYRIESVEADIDLSSLPDPSVAERDYGHALWRFVFADEAVRGQLRLAHARAADLGVPLRIRLFLDEKDVHLHRVHWELLRDPGEHHEHPPLAADEGFVFSRYVASHDTRDVRLRPRGALRALVVIANPSDLHAYGFARIDVEGETRRALESLAGIKVIKLAAGGTATLEQMLEHLGVWPGFDIVYLVCHGRLVENEPWLWLERPNGETHRVSGEELSVRLGGLSRTPSLVVLASCQSAGEVGPFPSGDAGALAGVGPRLTAQGVPAVLAMQGDVTMHTLERFAPAFFRALMQSGHIDQAVSIARSAILDRHDWWVPVLFTRLKGGRVWYTPGFTSEAGNVEHLWTSLLNSIRGKKCTPVLGPGITDGILGTRREIAVRWARAYHFPMALHQHENLPQVAQYLDVELRRDYLRDQFVKRLTEEVFERYGERLPELAALAPEQNTGRARNEILDELISTVGRRRRQETEHEPHHVLASLNLGLYVTASLSNLLTDALADIGRNPRTEHCRWRDDWLELEDTDAPRGLAGDPDRPLVYHLYGRLSEIDDIVLTEDDYFSYLIAVARNAKCVPPAVSNALNSSALMFLGFSLDDWTFRVLHQLIMSKPGVRKLRDFSHVAVQIDPEEGRNQFPDRARQYFEHYFRRDEFQIQLFWGSAQDFTKELAERWQNALVSG